MEEIDRPLLSPLTGAGLLVFRVVWMVLFALTVYLNTVAAYRSAAVESDLARIRYRAGVHIAISPAGGFSVSPFSPEARRRGLGKERLLAIDGHPAASGFVQLMRQLDGPENSRIALTVEGADGTPHVVALTRRDANIDQAYAGSGLNRQNLGWFYYLSNSLGGWSALIVALYLFVRRPGDPVAALLSTGMLLLFVNAELLWPDVPAALARLAPWLGTALIFAAILLFPDARPLRRWGAVGLIALAAYAAVAVARVFDSAFDATYGLVFIAAYAVVVAAAVARYRHLPRGTKRQQMKFALLGFAAAAILELLSVALAPQRLPTMSEGVTSWLLVLSTLADSLSIMALAAGLLISLLRYRLYDAETAISRSVMFGALTVILLAVFAGSEKVIEILGEEYFGEEMGVLAGGLGAAVAAAMIGPLHHRVSHWAEHRFQGGLLHLRQGLPVLLGDLRETATPSALAEVLLDRVEHGVRARHGAVLVHGGVVAARDIDVAAVQEWLATWEPGGAHHIDCDRADPLFPLRVRLHSDGAGQIGWLLLGPRPDGSFYGKDERETLAEIADPAARALAIVLERRRREATDRAAYDRLVERDVAREREVAGLRDRIDALMARLSPA